MLRILRFSKKHFTSKILSRTSMKMHYLARLGKFLARCYVFLATSLRRKHCFWSGDNSLINSEVYQKAVLTALKDCSLHAFIHNTLQHLYREGLLSQFTVKWGEVQSRMRATCMLLCTRRAKNVEMAPWRKKNKPIFKNFFFKNHGI